MTPACLPIADHSALERQVRAERAAWLRAQAALIWRRLRGGAATSSPA